MLGGGLVDAPGSAGPQHKAQCCFGLGGEGSRRPKPSSAIDWESVLLGFRLRVGSWYERKVHDTYRIT